MFCEFRGYFLLINRMESNPIFAFHFLYGYFFMAKPIILIFRRSIIITST